MDREETARYFDRILKIRALHAFGAEEESLAELERDFALEALDLMRRQPAMAEGAGVPLPWVEEAMDEADGDPRRRRVLVLSLPGVA